MQYTRLASTCNWQHTVLNICNLNMALHFKLNGNDFCRQDSPQTIYVLTNGYKNESVYDKNAVYKLLSAVLFTFSDDSAYNKPNSVIFENNKLTISLILFISYIMCKHVLLLQIT